MLASESNSDAPTTRFVALIKKLARRSPDWLAAERRRRRAKASTIITRNKVDILSDYVTSDYDSGDGGNAADAF